MTSARSIFGQSLAILALVLACSAVARVHAQDTESDLRFDLAARPLTLSLATLGAQVDDFGPGDGGGSYFVGERSPVRLEVFAGGIVPFEDDNLGFGVAASEEDFDAGGIFGFRLDFWLSYLLRLGGEIDFASHDVDGGPIFYPGHIDRIYFLVPLTFEPSFGDPARPWSIGFSIAPGLQVVVPDVDGLIEDIEAFNGRFIDEDDFVAFDLRAAITARVPLDTSNSVQFFVRGAFDFSWGTADVFVRNAIGRVLEHRRDQIDLSALSIVGGLAIVW